MLRNFIYNYEAFARHSKGSVGGIVKTVENINKTEFRFYLDSELKGFYIIRGVFSPAN